MSSSVLHFQKVKAVAILVARSPYKRQKRKEKDRERGKNTKTEILQKFCYDNLFQQIYFFISRKLVD